LIDGGGDNGIVPIAASWQLFHYRGH